MGCDDERQPFTAFPSVSTGIAAAVRAIQRGYPTAWAALLRGDPSWYGMLAGPEGYYEVSRDEAQASFNGVLRSVRAWDAGSR
jgi:hypothetical protein